MRVVFFQPYLAMWRIQFLQKYISVSQHEILVYDGGFVAKNDAKSVSNNRARFPVNRLFSWSPVFNIRGQEYPLFFSPALFFNLVRDRPDVVVTEGEINFINNFSIYLYCLIFRKGYVWWSLGKVRTRKKNIVNSVLDPLVSFLLRRAACVMARTTWAKRYYVEHKLVPESKVIVAPNSMDESLARAEVDESLISKLRGEDTDYVILYVGALTESKRPQDLVQAFSLLSKNPKYKNCELWFVGDGPQMGMLRSLVKCLHIEDRVKFFGKIFEGVGSYFSAADMVVVPGLGGLVINHAMIFGKPVVSRLADGTELDLVVSGETGFLLEDESIENMAEAISKVLLPENLERMSANAKAKVDQFWNMRVMIERVNCCIEIAGK